MEEIEVKFLGVNKAELARKFADIGARKGGEYLYKRKVFDYPDLRLDKKGAWIRLRDEGGRITLAYKERKGWKGNSGDDEGMYEVEFEVGDFEKAAEFLRSAGLAEKFYFENRRTRYAKDGIEFDVDEWPLLEPYLEIEAKSWEDIDKAIAMLGLSKDDAKRFSTTQIYALKGIDDKDYARLTFTEAVRKEK